MKYRTLFLLFLLILLEVAGEYLIKISTSHNNLKYLYFGMIIYLLVGLCFYFYIKTGKSFAVLNTIWQGANVVIVGLLSYFVLKEKLSKKQIIGILITLLGITLIEL